MIFLASLYVSSVGGTKTKGKGASEGNDRLKGDLG